MDEKQRIDSENNILEMTETIPAGRTKNLSDRKKADHYERKSTKNAMMIVFLILLCLFVGFFSVLYREDRGRMILPEDKDTLTVLCPKLSEAGDAFLLYKDGEGVLIDAGLTADGEYLVELIERCQLDSLKALILTHYDKDHIGGAAEVLRRIPVSVCYMTVGSEDSEEYLALMEALEENGASQVKVTETETFSLLNSTFTIYPPMSDTYEKNQDNNLSLMIKLSSMETEMLFAGDAEKERVAEFLQHQYDGTGYDFLKIPHHGRDKKTTKDFLAAFTPSVALITSSDEEPESDKVLEELEKAGVETCLTREGMVILKVNQYGIATSTIDGSSLPEVLSDVSETSESIKSRDGARDSSYGKKPSAPTFSRESGFYEEGFELTMEAPEGTTIYYTMDSSVPTTKSAMYKETVKITDPSSRANVHSMRTDYEPYSIYPAYEGQKEVYPGYYCRYRLPGTTVDKCAVVRAIAVDEDGNVSDVATSSYFIGYQNKKGYENISVISLVSDPEGLFGEEKGIMVNGVNYNEKLKNGDLEGIDSTHVLREYTNTYSGRGKEWERETHMDYFEENEKSLVLSQEIGIRLHGNQSRVAKRHKSFNLYAREEYDGNGTFGIPFFEDGILLDTVTLMRGSDVRNYVFSQLMDERTMDSQDYCMVQVFLDGEYWGLYAIQERYNSSQYMKTHYLLEKGDYDLFSSCPTGLEFEKGNETEARKSIRSLREFLAANDTSDPEVYQKICSMMDIQSFIDVYAARLYIGDQDWSWFKNQYLLRYEGKWHWLIYDVDYGAGFHEDSQPETDTFRSPRLVKRFSLDNDPLFLPLMKNRDFRRDFVNTFMDLANGPLLASNLAGERNNFLKNYLTAAEESMDRYPLKEDSPGTGSGSRSTFFQDEYDTIVSFFKKRYGYASRYMKDYFGLKGNLQKVTLTVNDSGGGTVKINTIRPELSEQGEWTGQYFNDFPVTVTATAAEGYHFTGWECEGGTLSDPAVSSTEVTFTGPVKIRACFRKNGQ